MKVVIAWVRLFALLISVVFFLLIVLLFYFTTPKKIWVYIVRFWAQCITFCIGARVEIIGERGGYLQPNTIVISNHISWLDIPILHRLYSVRFISRAEVKRWFLLNLLVKSGGTIYIDRNRKKDLLRLTHELGWILSDGDAIGFFPESKTTDGSKILPFKSSLFEAAILAEAQIIPIALLYCNKNNEWTTKITYAGELTLWQTLYNTLLLNNINVKVIILPKVNAVEFTSREDLSDYLHNQIKIEYQKHLQLYCPLANDSMF